MKIDKPLVVFDLETTGVDREKSEIIQFAAIRKEPGKKDKTLEFLCKPSVPVEDGAAEVHGITNEMLENEPPFTDFIDDVVNILDGAIIAGYNSNSFDIPILDRQLEENGRPNTFKDSYLFDTFILYKEHHPRKLENASMFYLNKGVENAHDAMSDVRATLEVLEAQLKYEKDNDLAETLEEVMLKTAPAPDKRVGTSHHIQFNDDGEPFINFGKHKDTLMKDMDFGYLKWMSRQDFPKPVTEFVINFMSQKV